MSELGTAFTSEGVGVPVIGSKTGNTNLSGIEVGLICGAEAVASVGVIDESWWASDAFKTLGIPDSGCGTGNALILAIDKRGGIGAYTLVLFLVVDVSGGARLAGSAIFIPPVG